jgi:hypothetical protein
MPEPGRPKAAADTAVAPRKRRRSRADWAFTGHLVKGLFSRVFIPGDVLAQLTGDQEKERAKRLAELVENQKTELAALQQEAPKLLKLFDENAASHIAVAGGVHLWRTKRSRYSHRSLARQHRISA